MLASIFCSAIPPPSPASSSYLDANVSRHNYTTRLGPSWRTISRRLSPPPSGAAEKEETQFEIDREKAREALQKLDQQLQTLSQQESLPKKRPPSPSLSTDLNLDRDRMTGMRIDEMPEISGSYLSYVAVALLILTIFNNIIFNAIIKPSVDGNEQASKIERVPLREPAEQSLKQLSQ
ncbi:putative Cytochrome b [Cocos nucifera]|uniref:Putative Cytochrome b n=1 Tax=Cocos nucifera TaxID=13894 RepID=A0A8K0IW13_COCNU|nr:putative Cytochrome b [Cocos nucifera]